MLYNYNRCGHTILGVAVAVLLLVVAVQGVVLYRMHQEQSAEKETAARPEITSAAQAETDTESEPKRRPNDATAWDPWAERDIPGFGRLEDDWDPFGEMMRLREQMDRLFGESFNRMRMTPHGMDRLRGMSFSPDMDLREEDGEYVIRFNIPGAEKDDIRVEIKDRLLTVSGVTNQQVAHTDEGRILRSERRQGHFSRTITLPGPVDTTAMQAQYEDGVLVVTVPKAV